MSQAPLQTEIVATGDRPTSTIPPRRRRWLRRLGVFLLVGACLYLFRHPTLRSIAGLLIVDEPAAGATFVVLLNPGEAKHIDAAAEFARSNRDCKFLIIQLRLRRVERMGIIPTSEAVARRELARRRVNENRISVLQDDGPIDTDWQRARCLNDWLSQNPQANVLLLCERFSSRRTRHILNALLPPENVARVHLGAVPHHDYDETNWWQHKAGLLDLFGGYMDLGHTWLCGDDTAELSQWDSDEFEKNLTRLH